MVWVFILLFCSELVANTISVDESSYDVSFLARGRPSAIKIRGRLKEPKGAITGQLRLKTNQLSGKLSLSLDALTTGIALRDRHMKQNYLETQKYPKAVLHISSLSLKDECSVTCNQSDLSFKAQLKLHGVQMPIAGVASVRKDESSFGIKLSFTVELTDFGIKIPEYLGITVAKNVEVTAELQAILKAS